MLLASRAIERVLCFDRFECFIPPVLIPPYRETLQLGVPCSVLPGAGGDGRNRLMNFNKSFSLSDFLRLRAARFPLTLAMLGLVGSFLPASVSLANGTDDHPPVLVLDEPAIFEQTHRLPDLEQKSALKPAIEHAVGVPDIDLDYVQDLRLIIDEARKKAQVEYLAEKLRQPPHTLQQYVQLAWEEASKRVGLRPELLLAIMHKESTFQPKVQSRYGAQGLMQVVRRWHREKLHKNESLFDPEVNVRVGTDVLEEYLEWAEGDLNKALVKYSGNARGYATTVLSESRKLAQVAEMAAAEVAEVAFIPEPDEPAPVAADELPMQAANEQAG